MLYRCLSCFYIVNIHRCPDIVLIKRAKTCVCPNGHEMMYHGDHFESNNKRYLGVKFYLKCSRHWSLQSDYIKRPLKEHGRQVSFVVDSENNVSYLDLMKRKVDSEQGRKAYSRRMWTVEPVLASNIEQGAVI